MASDQNFVGLANGAVVRARAIVRLVPEARWPSSKILSSTTTPMTERTRMMDNIETMHDPHAHSPSDREPGEPTEGPPKRRVRITLNDL